MTTLLAQAPTLQLFAPVLVAACIALGVLVLGRVVATRKLARAVATNAKWAPAIQTPPDHARSHPLNQVARRRITLEDLLESSGASVVIERARECAAAHRAELGAG